MWVFRYNDAGIQRSKNIGTLQKYKSKAAAEKAATDFRREINDLAQGVSMSALCKRFEKDGMPGRSSTSSPYRSYLKRVKEEWGNWRIQDFTKAVLEVEAWVNDLQTLETSKAPPRPCSRKTKHHMKAFVHRLIELAMKWGMIPMQRNPMALIEFKKGRTNSAPRRKLILLTSEQYLSLMSDPKLGQHVKVMIQVAMLLGLRASEFLGLRWEDLDFDGRIVHIRRSFVGKHEDDTKTEESAAELPMHDDLAEILGAWKKECTAPDGSLMTQWVFESYKGRPFWRDALQKDHLAPAGVRAGITKDGGPQLGWHAFRHTQRAMQGELDLPLEMQKTLMRHSDIAVTLGYGGKPSMQKLRAANAKVVEMLRKTGPNPPLKKSAGQSL